MFPFFFLINFDSFKGHLLNLFSLIIPIGGIPKFDPEFWFGYDSDPI